MKFISIKLVNFGNIKFLEKNFDNPLTILSGDNGNGKSTLIKAIRLAIFDSYDGVLQDYINWDAKEFYIEIKFVHKGVSYSLSVSYDGSTERILSFENETYTGDEAKRKIKDLIDLSLLKAAMLSLEQETDIVKSKPAERREYLKKIYNLDFKDEISHLENEIKECSLGIKTTETKIELLESEEFLSPEKPKEPYSLEEKEKIEKRLKFVDKTLNEAKNLLSQDKIKHEQYNNLQKELHDLRDKVSKETEKICKQKESLRKIPFEKEEKISGLKSSLEQLRMNKTSLKEEFDCKSNSIENKLIELRSALKRPKLCDMDLLNSYKARKEFITNKLSELRSVSDVCPMCGQKISSEEQISKRNKEIENLSEELESLRPKISALMEEKNQYDDTVRQNDLIKQKISDFEKELLQIKSEYDKSVITLDNKINMVSREFEVIDEKFLNEKTHLEEFIKISESNLNSLEVSVNKTLYMMGNLADSFLNEDFLKGVTLMETEFEDLKYSVSLYNEYMSKMEFYNQTLKEIELKKAENKKLIEQLKESLKNQCSEEADKEAELKILKTEFPVYVISRTIKDIESRMNEFLQRTYDGRYSVSVRDKGNSLSIIYGPKNQDVALSSGYERSLFNLAFKIAISRAIGNKCLVLDEADSAASPNNAKVFYSVLASTLGTYFEQIIMVTHKIEVKEMLEDEFSPDVITFIKGVPQ